MKPAQIDALIAQLIGRNNRCYGNHIHELHRKPKPIEYIYILSEYNYKHELFISTDRMFAANGIQK